MKQGKLAVPAVALALVAAGCGGGDKSNRTSAYKPPVAPQAAAAGADAARQDAGAKAEARILVTAVEACFVDQQDYSACKKPEGVTEPMGSGPGQAEVKQASTAGYTVVAHSESGTSFEVTKGDDGQLERSCDKPGDGGCEAGGPW
ncbi:MAG: hypothetical protein ACJ760_05920 [Thermoleophilaceae bacterium]